MGEFQKSWRALTGCGVEIRGQGWRGSHFTKVKLPEAGKKMPTERAFLLKLRTFFPSKQLG
jgi:hypothetical protein